MEEKGKISKAKGVEFCVKLLQLGKSRKNIIEELAEICNASERTVDNWIKEASGTVRGRQEQAENIRLMQMDANLTDAVKEGLLSDMEIELILCKIISGDVEVEEWVKGKAVLRRVSPTEVTNAAKAIYAKRGSNAPEKQQVDLTSNGQSIHTTFTIRRASDRAGKDD